MLLHQILMTYLYMLTFLLIVYIILNKTFAGYIDYVDFYENCQNLVFLLHVFKQISKLFEYTLQETLWRKLWYICQNHNEPWYDSKGISLHHLCNVPDKVASNFFCYAATVLSPHRNVLIFTQRMHKRTWRPFTQ